MKKKEFKRSTLVGLYHEEDMNLSEVGEVLDSSPSTISKRMDELGISKNSPTWETDRIDVECPNCGVVNSFIPSRVERSNNLYCNKDCKREHYGSGEFELPDHVGSKVEKQIVDCTQCGDSKEIYPYELEVKNKHFCNMNCYSKWRSENLTGEDSVAYKGGSSEPYTGIWQKNREVTREKYNHMCILCGERCGDRHHPVHHMIPARGFNDPDNAHHQSNLVLVCKKHHGMMEKLPSEMQYRMVS